MHFLPLLDERFLKEELLNSHRKNVIVPYHTCYQPRFTTLAWHSALDLI